MVKGGAYEMVRGVWRDVHLRTGICPNSDKRDLIGGQMGGKNRGFGLWNGICYTNEKDMKTNIFR